MSSNSESISTTEGVEITPPTPAQRQAAIFRRLASWLEEHPDFPVSTSELSSEVWCYLFVDEASKLIPALAAMPRPIKKETTDTTMIYKHVFPEGGQIRIGVAREVVCTKRVVGTKVVPEHEEEIVEWDCKPVLKGE